MLDEDLLEAEDRLRDGHCSRMACLLCCTFPMRLPMRYKVDGLDDDVSEILEGLEVGSLRRAGCTLCSSSSMSCCEYIHSAMTFSSSIAEYGGGVCARTGRTSGRTPVSCLVIGGCVVGRDGRAAVAAAAADFLFLQHMVEDLIVDIIMVEMWSSELMIYTLLVEK
jgi:hypothetical protein